MDRFTIVTVCSGNICRSPIAEQLLRARLHDIPQIALASAGTVAREGDVMPEQAQVRSRAHGGDPSAHTARVLSKAGVETANLALAMSREHRKAIVSLLPRASRYTFTLREFARVSEGISEYDLLGFGIDAAMPVTDRLIGLVELVASRRGTFGMPEHPDDDDIVDPYRRDDATYDRSLAELLPAVEEVTRVIRLTAGLGS